MRELKIFYDSSQKIGHKTVTDWLEQLAKDAGVGGFTLLGTLEGKGRKIFHSSRNLLGSFQTPHILVVVEKKLIVNQFIALIRDNQDFHGFIAYSDVTGEWINPV